MLAKDAGTAGSGQGAESRGRIANNSGDAFRYAGGSASIGYAAGAGIIRSSWVRAGAAGAATVQGDERQDDRHHAPSVFIVPSTFFFSW